MSLLPPLTTTTTAACTSISLWMEPRRPAQFLYTICVYFICVYVAILLSNNNIMHVIDDRGAGILGDHLAVFRSNNKIKTHCTLWHSPCDPTPCLFRKAMHLYNHEWKHHTMNNKAVRRLSKSFWHITFISCHLASISVYWRSIMPFTNKEVGAKLHMYCNNIWLWMESCLY